MVDRLTFVHWSYCFMNSILYRYLKSEQDYERTGSIHITLQHITHLGAQSCFAYYNPTAYIQMSSHIRCTRGHIEKLCEAYRYLSILLIDLLYSSKLFIIYSICFNNSKKNILTFSNYWS